MKTLSNKETEHLSCVSVADPEISEEGDLPLKNKQ
jgi:hypothetical protein